MHCLTYSPRSARRGSILVLSAFMMIVLVGCLAFALDVGYAINSRTELQRAADAAALAAAWELIDEEALSGHPGMNVAMDNARIRAGQFAALNDVCRSAPSLGENGLNDPAGDVVVGFLGDFSDPAAALSFREPDSFNAIQVRVQRTQQRNGLVPVFFAQIFGIDGFAMEGRATAAVVRNVGGFQVPGDDSNLGILPFALDEETWTGLLAGNAADDWVWDEMTQQIFPGSDGILEVNLFPQGTGSPGNRGTVDIGGSNNSTADIKRQILEGISPADLDYHGGSLEFDRSGQLPLNADTGISAAVKAQLAQIAGQPRFIPVFSEVDANGNNGVYTIVKFVGIRILEVKLTGKQNSKRVIVQPANVVTKGVIPPATALVGTTDFVYSRPVLVR